MQQGTLFLYPASPRLVQSATLDVRQATWWKEKDKPAAAMYLNLVKLPGQ